MTFDLNFISKIAPVLSGLLIVLIYWLLRLFKKKPATLEDIFVVGLTGSSFPSGLLFIAAAFDAKLLDRVSEAPVYIAIAGFAVLYIAGKTLLEKSVA